MSKLLISIKDSLSEALPSISSLAFVATFSLARGLVLGAIVLGLISVATTAGPSLYRTALFETNYRDVVYLRVVNPKGGAHHGTAFHVDTPSGNQVLVTNFHVCGTSQENNSYEASLFGHSTADTHVIKKDPTHDLCILSPVGNLKSFPLSDNALLGLPVFALGFPSYMPWTLTSGDIVGWVGDTSFRRMTTKLCLEYKGKPSLLSCKFTYQALQTTIPVRGGSSGSPVMNMLGSVIGVVTKQERGHWGIVIPSEHVINLIKEL
ncbi:MAG: hypothetical protein DRN30_04155 [Thermoplasmata archaeon]|nr:MAG: hypothetical protein DRN30_04155 [Thermoplasmata archaeon]